jgi:hypothetical protein
MEECQMVMAKCRHCYKHKANRPRGLCWRCFYQPGLKEQYPSTSKYAYRGVADRNGRCPLPSEPTQVRPGTPEKMTVLEQRAERGESLFHPADATFGNVYDRIAITRPTLEEWLRMLDEDFDDN